MVLILLFLVASGCAEAGGPEATPSTSAGVAKTVPALKLEVLDAVGGRLAFCDPDEFPVSNGSALESARARLPEIRADRAAYEAILAHKGYSDAQEFTPGQQIAISEDYKQMQAIDLRPDGDVYSFSVLVSPSGSDVATMRVSGTVTVHGSVTIDRREEGQQPNCPICLAADVRIATPNGEIPVQDIRVGMRVWTTDPHGRRVVGIVRETGHMEVPLGHEIVRLKMADGRSVIASPGHPTADGRMIADLQAGDSYDGGAVANTALIPYVGATWDVLPSGQTATYFANGVLLRSTLAGATVRALEGS